MNGSIIPYGVLLHEILSAILGETVQNPGYVSRTAHKSGTVSREDSKRYVWQLAQVYYHLGYDYLILPAYLPMGTYMLVGGDTAALRREAGRAWVAETKGPVTNWSEFEGYGWCQVTDADTYAIEAAARVLPEGMGLIGFSGGVLEWASNLLGLENEFGHIDAFVADDDAFGKRNLELLQEVPLKDFPPGDPIQVGGKVTGHDESGEAVEFTVTDISDGIAHLDGNHPLAGQTLVFEVEIQAIRDASSEELTQGKVLD